MADTIINTPGQRDDASSALSWVVALIVILAIIVAAFVWFRNGASLSPGTSNINVTIPNTGGNGGGGTDSGPNY